MTEDRILEQLAALSREFRTIPVSTLRGGKYTREDLHKVERFCEATLLFSAIVADVCNSQHNPELLQDGMEIRKAALEMVHCLRKVQMARTLTFMRQEPGEHIRILLDRYEDIVRNCRAICGLQNPFLLDWFDAATQHS